MNGPSIFVFGSNRAGRHGKGAALHARTNCRAEQGVGEGRTGMAYALPTKDEDLNPVPLEAIASSIDKFLECAVENPTLDFLVTPIGTGLAGHPRRDIAGLFMARDIPENVIFSREWFQPSK